MQKRVLGLFSAILAGMLTVTGISPIAEVAYATDVSEAGVAVASEEEDSKFLNARNISEAKKLKLEFTSPYQEYLFAFEEALDVDLTDAIRVSVSDLENTICFNLYDDDKENVFAKYSYNGKNEYELPTTIFYDVVGLIRYVGIASVPKNKTNYPYSVTVESISPVYKFEENIVNLRDPITANLGEDFIIGTTIDFSDFGMLERGLITKHFNGVTFTNLLHPEYVLSQSEIITYNLNGEDIQVPELKFAIPDRYLNFFVNWNNEHPDKKIRVRGNALVLHSLTPEFFFHEEYNTSKPYVTPEVMNKRLEYYIKGVAEHFTAVGSEYRDLFYGWDVVNEAVSDDTGIFRNSSEGSSWWTVYNSPEFIQNAYVYANKYMPENMALFYSDYNECATSKVNGICELLLTVKETPGARIDGIGMQAHYQVAEGLPSMEQFKKAARAYSSIVDQVQVTELYYKGCVSSNDERLAVRYKELYDTIRRLKYEGVNITGMTIRGLLDKYGYKIEFTEYQPFLFDEDYKAKPAFWALANAGELEPGKKSVTLVQNVDNYFKAGNTYEFNDGDSSASFVPMWTDDAVYVKVAVNDTTVDDTDSFTVYTDDGVRTKAVTVKRADARESETGYVKITKIRVDKEVLTSGALKVDVAVTDGEKTFAFGDTSLKQGESSKYFASTDIKPSLSIKKGTIEVDGDLTDEAWNNAPEVPLTINLGSNVSATAKLLWDEENLYVLANVKDEVLNKDSSQAHEQDSLEVFIDENNHKSTSYEDDDKQYRINYENVCSFNGKKCLEENVKSVATAIEDGYIIEAAFKWTDIKARAGVRVGLELQINDADASGKRSGTLSWADTSGNGWSSPSVFGTVRLVAE